VGSVEDPLSTELVAFGGESVSVRTLIDMWAATVADFVSISETGRNPHEWHVYDVVAALELRETIEAGLRRRGDRLSLTVADRRLDEADQNYRAILIPDPDNVLRDVTRMDITDEAWATRASWWRGLPPNLAPW
jgi:hypothetical protein